MNDTLPGEDWLIVEEGFHPDRQKKSESLFSLGNGHMGMRANFEEEYSGPTLRGFYLAGVYYPDKTRVGWWKVGYPESFAKVLNAPAWTGMSITMDDQEVDLARMTVSHFRRILDMRGGVLYREFIAAWPDGRKIQVKTERFLSMHRRELGALLYSISPMNFSGTLKADLLVDGDIVNEDANYREKFWEPAVHSFTGNHAWLLTRTRKTGFGVCLAVSGEMRVDGQLCLPEAVMLPGNNRIAHRFQREIRKGQWVTFTRFAGITTTRDHHESELTGKALNILDGAERAGYPILKEEHKKSWETLWNVSDIIIDGDPAAQQGIRFSIFHLNQTYTGHDPRLNIGPKGFTGEKYGGSTYWDTEAFCFPFYLGTAGKEVAINLLRYRYNHLPKAIENAARLGFTGGAALFPMVTMNGEECHNEWEITFEEIHRNGAIAYALYSYIRQTGDSYCLQEFALEILIALSRFWAQRFTFSVPRQKFVMLGVTGPNEYENNVDNNWYTNYIARWTLEFTLECIDELSVREPDNWMRICEVTGFRQKEETGKWKEIHDNAYLPENQELGIFLQQDGYLEKEQILAAEVPVDQRPINQHWSWDRILRSSLIKQADVLQGLYFFGDRFPEEVIRRNFEFYEPRTVHESSLSPSIHAIIASRIGETEQAHKLFLRSARLDLDDYNHEVQEGCHVTSMAGTWLAAVEGFGGMRIEGDRLRFTPAIPAGWNALTFSIRFRGRLLTIDIRAENIRVWLQEGPPIGIDVLHEPIRLNSGEEAITVRRRGSE